MPLRLFVCAALIAGILTSGCFFGVTSYRDEDNALVYVGLVQNEGAPLVNPVVQGTFYDANGNVIATQEGSACRVMPSGSIAAFKVTLPPNTAQPAKADWKLTGEAVDDAYLAEGLTGMLFGDGDSFPPGEPRSHFGEMRNNSGNTYSGGDACVAWTNDRGEVLRMSSGSAAGLKFAPGGVLPFVVREDVPPEATGALLFLDAGVTPPGRPAPTFVEFPRSAFQHALEQSGPSPTGGLAGTLFLGLGELHNTGSTLAFMDLVAVTRDAAGHPTGMSDSYNASFCRVPAAPGGFTYGSYIFNAAGTAPALEVKIEGVYHPLNTTEIIATSGVTHSSSGAGERVRGTIKNTTSETLTSVDACAGVYDASGKVIGAFPGYPTLPAGGLAPNQTVSVTIDVPTFGNANSAKLIASGRP
jgi:hypothetical protein